MFEEERFPEDNCASWNSSFCDSASACWVPEFDFRADCLWETKGLGKETLSITFWCVRATGLARFGDFGDICELDSEVELA